MRPTPHHRAAARSGRTGWLAIALLLAAAGHAGEPDGQPPLAEAWQALSVNAYADAAARFDQAEPSREAALGAALARVKRPPVTPASLEDARRRLESLAATRDSVGRAACYFLGRLHQLHPLAPDPAAAARDYEALVATGADDTWCRLALVKLAVLRLTVLPGPADPAARWRTAEDLLARTRDPVTQRDLHLVIAEARLHHEAYDRATLGHLQAALAATAADDVLRPDALIQAGRLAKRLGDRAAARGCFETFLRDYPKDRRAFTVAAALAHLGDSFLP